MIYVNSQYTHEKLDKPTNLLCLITAQHSFLPKSLSGRKETESEILVTDPSCTFSSEMIVARGNEKKNRRGDSMNIAGLVMYA